MRFIFFPVGSHGDVHPFVGLGRALRARGHRVQIATNGYFGGLIQQAGLEFIETSPAAEYQRLMNHPDLWSATRAFPMLMREAVLPSLRAHYQLVEKLLTEARAENPTEKCVVGAGLLALGIRIAHEKLGFPLVSVHLQPTVFRSAINPPALPGMGFMRRMPAWFNRSLYWLMDCAVIDPLIARKINALRAELGLRTRVKRIANEYWHSPQKIIALFPEWFMSAPDWPAQCVQAGFPLFDEKGLTQVEPELDKFLNSGSPPVAFTPGSGMSQGQKFFSAAVEACARLNKRGLLLTRFPAQLPAQLPEGVRHFPYAPFSQILPRCAALVYHGGIGTASQALAAGIPHLVMPMAHDQPDNAAILTQLGVGRALWPRQFTGPNVARSLAELLDGPTASTIANACKATAAKVQQADGIARACDEFEKFALELA